MAKIRNRRLFWDAPAAEDVVGYDVFVAAASIDSVDFLAQADAGVLQAVSRVPGTEYFPDQPEGDYQYCVVAVDDAGNESDPYQADAWQNVPLDVTPPAAPSGGGIEFAV